MKYIVNNKKFASLVAACQYADAIHRKTGVFVSVEAIRPRLGGVSEPLLVYDESDDDSEERDFDES